MTPAATPVGFSMPVNFLDGAQPNSWTDVLEVRFYLCNTREACDLVADGIRLTIDSEVDNRHLSPRFAHNDARLRRYATSSDPLPRETIVPIDLDQSRLSNGAAKLMMRHKKNLGFLRRPVQLAWPGTLPRSSASRRSVVERR